MMTTLFDLMKPFRGDSRVLTPASTEPSATNDDEKHLFTGQTRHRTDVADFDRSFWIASDPYGLVIFKSRSSNRQNLFMATLIDRDEMDQVINALRAARDLAFPLEGDSA